MSLDNLTKFEIPVEVQEALDRAYTLETDGNLEEALRVCDSILRDAPELAEVHNLRGIILEQTGDKEEALEAYRMALELEPGFDDARQNLLDLEEDIFETRYHVQRPNLVKVIVWGAVAYGVCFGLAGGLSAFIVFPLSRFPLVMMLLGTSLYALGSGIGAFVIGEVSRFKNALLLGIACSIGGSLGRTGTALVIHVVGWFFPLPMSFFIDPPSFDLSILLRYAVIGAMTGLGLGLVQKTQRQMIHSILAGVIGFCVYALALPIYNNMTWDLGLSRFMPESASRLDLRFTLIYAFVEFIFGCIFGGIIGALFGWVVAHNPVQNLRVVEERTS